MKVNDFSISIATVNGSGSQSSNNILMRSIFRMGVPVEGKNIFPSNIAGLPTWFSIRVNEMGYTSREEKSDIFVAMNPETFAQDLEKLKPGGWLIYNKTKKIDESLIPETMNSLGIDFNALVSEVSKSIQLKKLLVNIVYVGVLAELLQIPDDILEETIRYQFKGKEKVFQVNHDALCAGRNFIKNQWKGNWFYQVKTSDKAKGKILIDGNAAAALGLVFGGCSFASWYPITPSSSLAEGFVNYCEKFRIDDQGKKYAVVQAEDELSAITMVAGAGWAGSRSMTVTSGPGISLMSETIGLMYFAEIPGVIWDVQRMGPSTGLPTRTSQGDVLACANLSHGDTQHPVLFPSNPQECFEFAQEALDLAEEAQTPVFVLSDLDIGMNTWISDPFEYPKNNFKRGKVLGAEQLEKMESFGRYEDVDGDGIPYRTHPGTEHDLAAYFTRGTGHTPTASYSEDNKNYEQLLDRLEKKWQTIKSLVPKPEYEEVTGAHQLIVYYGSTRAVISELKSNLDKVSFMRLKAFPFHQDVAKTISKYDRIVVVEQNKQGQLATLLRKEFPNLASRVSSVTNYDGFTISEPSVRKMMQRELGL